MAKRKVKVIPENAVFRSYMGGRTEIGAGGYILEHAPGHPACQPSKGFVHQHRLVMEKRLGRYLSGLEVVHHINHIRTDNRDENLQLFENHAAHLRFHRQKDAKITNPSLIAAMRPLAADPSVGVVAAARRLGMSHQTVYMLCKKNKIRWVSAGEKQLTTAMVRRALRGRTTLEAANLLGCNHQTLRNRFDRLLKKRKSPILHRTGPDVTPVESEN